MSDVVVLVCILWAVAMTGIAWHYYVMFTKSVKAGTRMMMLMIGIGTGSTTFTKNDDGSFCFENDEQKVTIGRVEQ